MKLRLLLFVLLLPCLLCAADIVPSPRHRTVSQGQFVITSSTKLSAPIELHELVAYLRDYLPITCEGGAAGSAGEITLAVDSTLAFEAYRLRVEPSLLEITGGGYGGVFNGIQTLLQLLPEQVYSRELNLPVAVVCQRIDDAPRFSYRGLHLDVARTWMEVDRVKRYIDLMSHHKINKLHFHLTDDEGWRVEIRSHPELALVGGFRGGDSPIRAVYGKWGEKYGGYYTQEELRDIVRYANLRNVEVIPEFDLPGHSRNIAHVWPEILCRYTPNTTASDGYDERSAWCVAREQNYVLLEDILTELCDIFPSPYIHIGGDEVNMKQWELCPDCKALMDDKQMTNVVELQHHFMSRLVDILARNGKQPAVWNEAIRGGRLPMKSRVHGWENIKECLVSTGQGYSTVVMPGSHFYFDMRQSSRETGHIWAAITDAQKVYQFDFSANGFTPEHMQYVEGVEGAFWTEIYASNSPEKTDYSDFMLFPRLCALSELGWHGNARSWEQFRSTFYAHYDRLSAMGIRFRLEPPVVEYQMGLLRATTDDGSKLFYRTESDTTYHAYTAPISTSTPQHYLFESRCGLGRSAPTGAAAYYKTIQPNVHITSSINATEGAPYSRAEQYRSFARTTRTVHLGDWMLFTFTQPVVCREVFIQTGYIQLPKLIFDSGYAEISYDGEHFERVGELVNGSVRITNPAHAIKALRITSTTQGNGCASVLIQPLQIKP